MRVAVVYFDLTRSQAFDRVTKALAKGVERQGHDVRVVNAALEAGISLTPFEYIAVGTRAASLWNSSIDTRLTAFLRSSGILAGKRSYAFVHKSGLRKNKLLLSLMKAMEAEGMFLKKSDVLISVHEAEAVGERLHIEARGR